MKKVLFIYGFGGGPDSSFCRLLRERLPQDQFTVISERYPQDDCAAALQTLKGVIEREHVDIVVGTSLGGFITLALSQVEGLDLSAVSRFVINPCMRPSVELPLLKPRPNHPEDKAASAEMIETYKPFEDGVLNTPTDSEVRGLFGKDDELFGLSYRRVFNRNYRNRSIVIRGGHHGNAEGADDIAHAIMHPEVFDSRKEKSKIFFDMDGVLVDFTSALRKCSAETLAEYAGREDEIPDIFSLMEPVEGALEAVRRLHAAGYDLYILSTAPWLNPSAWSAKVEWVHRYFGSSDGAPFYKQMIITHCKGLLADTPDAYLIDDRTKHGADLFGERHLHFRSQRFPDWKSVVDFFLPED